MNNSEILDGPREIIGVKQRSSSTEFGSRQRGVNSEGEAVGLVYGGHQYRVIEKRERTRPLSEYTERSFSEILAIVYTLCLALFSKFVRNLFTKSKMDVRFGLREEQTKFNLEQVGHFLKRPSNSIITEEEFFTFIQERDQTGTPRICTLNSANILEVLTIIKEKNIPLNLDDKTPEGQTLFTLWAGKGNAKITGIMLELDPSVVEQIQGQTKSAFVEAALNGHKEEADILINAMEKRNSLLSPEEVWIKRALKNDCVFCDEEFTQLDPQLKIKIFFVANACANENIVKKLKSLGMNELPLFWPGPHIFACNMDIVTARNVMENFLKDLKREGLLLTEEEFSKLDENNYIRKLSQIGRIQGRNFIERLAKENGLKHIKVPKKIVVINKGLETISFRIAASLELASKPDQLKLYAERVQHVDRKLSLEEAVELMIILEKTGYSDFFGHNLFFAEDGIYFIDTEFKDFSPTQPQFGTIKSIKDMIQDPEDTEKFLVEYERRKESYEKLNERRNLQENECHEAFKNRYKILTDGYQRHEFTFQLSSL